MVTDHMQHLVDAKIMVGASTTGVGTAITWAHQVDPYIDVAAGAVAIVAGILTIIYTAVRLWDRYKGR